MLNRFVAYSLSGTRLRDTALSKRWGEEPTKPVLVFWREQTTEMPDVSPPLKRALNPSTIVLVVADIRPEYLVDVNATITNESLHYLLKSTRKETGLTSLGALVMVGGETLAIAASGERKLGSDVKVSIHDKWHHGSITKSMTATLIGKLVQRGQLRWEQTLPELLPDLADSMHDSWNSVSLHQLLTHTSGARPNLLAGDAVKWPETIAKTHVERKDVIRRILQNKTWSTPGDEFNYSNVGYTIVGLIAAETAGKPWETLMRDELFEPLELESAGFGPPRGDGPMDQPWGHASAFGLRIAKDPAEQSDNTPLIGPAGTVHMSMSDLAKYGWAHLQGESTETEFLSREIFETLHAPQKGNYGYGWISTDVDWAGGE